MIDLTPYINKEHEIWPKMAIHCSTKGEVDTLMDIAKEQGHDDVSFIWDNYKEKSCIVLYRDGDTRTTNIERAAKKERAYIIIPCSDILFPFPPPTPMSEEDFNNMLFG